MDGATPAGVYLLHRDVRLDLLVLLQERLSRLGHAPASDGPDQRERLIAGPGARLRRARRPGAQAPARSWPPSPGPRSSARRLVLAFQTISCLPIATRIRTSRSLTQRRHRRTE